MNDDQRPWWASSDRGQTTTDDPVEAHRAARRGTASPHGTPQDARRTDGRATDSGSARPSRPAEPSASGEALHSHADVVCGVCPICVLARTLGDTHPELLGHLTEAARHLAAAARAVLDPSGPDEPGSEGVQRIDLD